MDESDEDRFDELLEILSNDGVNGLEFFGLKHFENYGRGLSSLLSRQPGEELFRIPLNYLFTDYKIEIHPKLSQIWAKYPKILFDFQENSQSETGIYPFLLLFYLEVINPSNKFNELWFSLFPRNLKNHTIAWTDKELKACGNLCPIRRDTIEIQVWIKKTHRFLKPIISEFKDTVFGGDNAVTLFDESMVEFLCMTCRNRGVALAFESSSQNNNESKESEKKKNEKETLYHCFIPIGDFGNHKVGANAKSISEYQHKRRHLNDENINLFVKHHKELMNKKYFEFDSKSDSIIVRAQEAILSGGQICYEYNSSPNWELLCNFGFAVPYNPFDRVILSVLFDNPNEKRLAKELKLLNEIGVSSFLRRVPDPTSAKKYKHQLSVALTLRDACPAVLLAANRIKSLSDQQLDQFTARDVVFMDRLILQSMNNKTATPVNNEKDMNKLKIMELDIVRNLQGCLNILFEGYKSEKPNIDPKELKHDSVNIMYESIRMILNKCIQILDGKVQDLAQ